MGEIIRRPAVRAMILFAAAVLVSSMAIEAVQLGDVQVTLQSHKYDRHWDLTRLVYRVKSTSLPSDDDAWVLGVGACVTDELIVTDGTTPFDWVEGPTRGLRFERSKRNEKVYVWLVGRWEVGASPIAVLTGGDMDFGEIDGPSCDAASIALETVSGTSVSFPSPVEAGTYAASTETILRVTSTSAGWSLSHSLEVSVPEGASEETVARALQVSYDPFGTVAGTTDVAIGYALHVTEEDFVGLPQGAYVILITYSVAAD